MGVCPKRLCISTVGIRKDLYPKDPFKVLITDFFGSVRPVQLTLDVLPINGPVNKTKEPKKTESKTKYSYVPQVPDFNSFIVDNVKNI